MATSRPELSLVAVSIHDHDAASNDSDSSDTDMDADTDSTGLDSDASITDASSAELASSLEDSSSDDDTSTASCDSDNDNNTAFYKSAHWTRDGTTIITSSWDNRICSFRIPEHLLEPKDQPLTLRPTRTIQLAEPTHVAVSAPYYDIRYDNTDHLLVASQDHPIQLYQTGTGSSGGDIGRVAPIASYHFTSPTTEAYYPIHSLLWSSPLTTFYVGTRDLIAQFDITRNGEGPSYVLPTIPSRRHIRKGNGIGMRGTVSALSAQATEYEASTGLVAAGTWTRCVGLYDMARAGECTATWSIKQAADSVVHTDPPADPGQSLLATKWQHAGGNNHPVKGIAGSGITQTTWSPCGRYLLLNERCSTGMLVYDVRGTNKVLGFLAGRNALTHQRMSCDVYQGADSMGGFEVWGGAMDGTVKIWEGVGNTEGCQWPSWDFSAADEAQGFVAPALGSVALHPSGSVVATCAGSWLVPGGLRASSEEPAATFNPVWKPQDRRLEGSSLKLWRIGANVVSDEVGVAVESDQSGATMREPDDIEQHRQRVLSALGATELDEPQPTARSTVEVESAAVSETKMADDGEPMDVPAEHADVEPMDLSAEDTKGIEESGTTTHVDQP